MLSRSRRGGRTALVGTAVLLLLGMALLVGTTGAASAQPASTATGITPFASLSSPSAVAATPTELLALSSTSCTSVYSIGATGAVSVFATLQGSFKKCDESALAISSGLGNFPAGEVYVLQSGELFEIPSGGSTSPVSPALLLPNLTGTYVGLTFDYYGAFGYALLASGGKIGSVVAISPTNQLTNVGNFGLPVEGAAVAPLGFGSVGGDLLVASEGHPRLYAMAPNGSTQLFSSWPNPETVSFVPNLACSFSTTGNSYFVADASANSILAYPSSTFTSVRGSGLVLGEFKGAGVAELLSSGATSPLISIAGTLEGAAYVACPIGVSQSIDLKTQSLDTSGLNLIGFDPATQELVGANPVGAPDQIVLLNGLTGAYEGQVPVGTSPSSVAYHPEQNQLFVANSGSSNVTILDASTFVSEGSLPTGTGTQPVALLVDPSTELLYVANGGTGPASLSVYQLDDMDDGAHSTALSGAPIGLVLDPIDGHVYVAGNVNGAGTVWEFAAGSYLSQITLSSSLSGIAVNSTSGLLYVALPNANELQFLTPGNPPALGAVVTVPSPVGVAFDIASGLVYVSSSNGEMYVLSGTVVVATFEAGQNPGPLVYDPASQFVYWAADVSNPDPRIILGG